MIGRVAKRDSINTTSLVDPCYEITLQRHGHQDYVVHASLQTYDSGDRSRPTQTGRHNSSSVAKREGSPGQPSQWQECRACYAFDEVGHMAGRCPHRVFLLRLQDLS